MIKVVQEIYKEMVKNLYKIKMGKHGAEGEIRTPEGLSPTSFPGLRPTTRLPRHKAYGTTYTITE